MTICPVLGREEHLIVLGVGPPGPRGWVCIGKVPTLSCSPFPHGTALRYLRPGKGNPDHLLLWVMCSTCRRGSGNFLPFPELLGLNSHGNIDVLPHNAGAEPSTFLSHTWTDACPGDTDTHTTTTTTMCGSLALSHYLTKQEGIKKSVLLCTPMSAQLTITQQGQNSLLCWGSI